MLRGIYTAASGMLADQTRLDVLSNNLANASTTGFKRDSAVTKPFGEMLLARLGDRLADGTPAPPAGIGTLGLGAVVVQTATRLTSGSLRQTGNPLDVAIMGDGFFTVRTPQGVRYTRQGSFIQDAEGRLTTVEGHVVLVSGQEVGEKGARLTITDEGEVLNEGFPLGKLDILTSTQAGGLKKEGGALWAPANDGEALQLIVPERSSDDPRGAYQLRTGFVETSNVEPVLEMVDLISTVRSYEANQKAVQAQDETLAKLVTEVGRV